METRLTLARERALELRAHLGISGVLADRDLRLIVAETDLRVVEGCPFVGRVREVYVAGVLGLGKELSTASKRWLTCRGVGHHLLHRCGRLTTDARVFRRQDAEVEAFACALMYGETLWDDVAS